MKKSLLISLLCAGLAMNMMPVDVEADTEKKNIVCAAFPEYDWVREILGNNIDDFNVTLLFDNGADVHSFQPSAQDIAVISSCDMLVYAGGTSEVWIDDVLKEAVNKDMQRINLMEFLGEAVKEEEVVEGMQKEHDHEEHDHEEEVEYDEHIWLSLKNAKLLVQGLTEQMIQLDVENESVYQENSKAYVEKLDELDKKYQEMVDNAKRNTLLFADRFPFRYLTEDYDLEYFAAFAGCSAETEASFETVTFLSEKMNELELPVILVIENSDQKIAEVIRKNTKAGNQEILTLNSLQSVTDEAIKEGCTYLLTMEENYQVLETALN